MTDRQELQSAFDALLQPERFKDYCPNGLQVEGTPKVRKIVSGVTASLALIDAAIAQGVYRRGLAGNSSNPDSVKMSRSPRERAELAWSLVS